MTIKSEKTDQSAVIIYLSGHMDSSAAPQFERELKQWGEDIHEDIHEVILDFLDVTYICDMCLRVLLQAQKHINFQNRKLVLRNMPWKIWEVFKMSGFDRLVVLIRDVSRKNHDGLVEPHGKI